MGHERHAGIERQQVPIARKRAKPALQRAEAPVRGMAAPTPQQTAFDPRMASPEALLFLQRTIGNAAVNQLLRQHTPDTPAQRPVSATIPASSSPSSQSIRRAAAVDGGIQSETYTPDTAGGLYVLAHEMAPTMQRANGPAAGTPHPGGMSISDPGASFKGAAEDPAQRVITLATARPVQHTDTRGAAARGGGLAPALQRNPITATLTSIGSGIVTGATTIGSGIVTGAKATGSGITTAAKATGSGITTAAKATWKGAKAADNFFTNTRLGRALAFVPVTTFKIVFYPIFKLIQVIRNAASKDPNKRIFDDLRTYWEQFRSAKSIVGRIFPVLMMIYRGFLREVPPWLGWVALMLTIASFGYPPIGAAAGLVGGIALLFAGLNAAIDSLVNAKYTVEAWAHYKEAKDNHPHGGDATKKSKVDAYLKAYRFYQKSRGEAIAGNIAMAINIPLAGVGGVVSGAGFAGGLDPSQTIGGVASQWANPTTGTALTGSNAVNIGASLSGGGTDLLGAATDKTGGIRGFVKSMKSRRDAREWFFGDRKLRQNSRANQQGQQGAATTAAAPGQAGKLPGPPGASAKGVVGAVINPFSAIAIGMGALYHAMRSTGGGWDKLKKKWQAFKAWFNGTGSTAPAAAGGAAAPAPAPVTATGGGAPVTAATVGQPYRDPVANFTIQRVSDANFAIQRETDDTMGAAGLDLIDEDVVEPDASSMERTGAILEGSKFEAATAEMGAGAGLTGNLKENLTELRDLVG